MSEQGYKAPLIDLLRNVPKDHRTQWPIQWSENGSETGHAMCSIGRLAHEAADRIVELEALQSGKATVTKNAAGQIVCVSRNDADGRILSVIAESTPQPVVDEDWLPTSANINALAAPVRRYIHDLITNADPSGMVAENTLLRDQTRQLDAMIGRLKAQPVVPEGYVPMADYKRLSGLCSRQGIRLMGYETDLEKMVDALDKMKPKGLTQILADALLAVHSGSSLYGIETRLCRLEKMGLVVYSKPKWRLTVHGEEVCRCTISRQGRRVVNDVIREAFEKINEPTESVYYNEKSSEYCWGYTSVAAPFNDKWESFCEGWQAALQSGEPVGEVDERLHDLSERLRATDSQNRYLSLSEQHEICDFLDELPSGNLYTAPQPVVPVKHIVIDSNLLIALLSTSHPDGTFKFDYRGISTETLQDVFEKALLSAGKENNNAL